MRRQLRHRPVMPVLAGKDTVVDEFDVDEVVQRSLDRLSLLADVSTALAGTMDADEGLRRVCRIVAHRLGDWCAVDVVTAPGIIIRACATHRDDGPRDGGDMPVMPALSPDASGPLARALRGAGPLLPAEEDLRAPGRDSDAFDAGEQQRFADLNANSAVIAPLRSRNEVLGALSVARCDPHPPLGEADLPLAEELAHRVALAVDNARLHQETGRIAERLQRSLLPELHNPGSLRMAARYAPAHDTAKVGGDWYDSFVLPKGDTTMIIGDVTGHDLKAAVTMSQLRNMLRGIACDRQEPPEAILHRLDVAHNTLYPASTATCIYSLVKGSEGGPWVFEYAVAGHPPPLLVTREGDTHFLEGGRGLLLGVHPGALRIGAAEPLPPQATLLLYTDGLVERRDEPIGRGLTRLRQRAGALARESVETFCDELLADLGSGSTDDVALLALRLPPAGTRAATPPPA
jgi:serine phosphatase RsbU (regulator of sigma subunit)